MLIDSNGSTPLRDMTFQRRLSMAACSTRRSVVNDCSAPPEPPVRTIATRSVGRSSRSTKSWSARRIGWTLSTERPRSSTTSANVRCTSSFLIVTNGAVSGAVAAGAAAGADSDREGGSAPVSTGTNCAKVTFCALPFWRTSKSDAVRSETMRPSRSVTTASMRTASTPTLKRGTSGGCCADSGNSR
jgi:hypothetical protein